jgi:hypothetical protein
MRSRTRYIPLTPSAKSIDGWRSGLRSGASCGMNGVFESMRRPGGGNKRKKECTGSTGPTHYIGFS